MDLPRLYAILDVEFTTARGLSCLEVLDTWLAAGVRLIQVRAKALAAGPFLELAAEAATRTKAAGALLIVNDRLDVALMSGADGVHLGQEDLPVSDARRIAGDRFVIGLSTHSIEQLNAGLAEPISYVAIGPVFATSTKQGSADPAVGLDVVRQAAGLAKSAGRPLVAIGGIALETAASVLEAGAGSSAVISDLLTGDPGRRARAFGEALVRSGS